MVQFDAVAIGKRIREQREYRGWSLADVAARLGELGHALTPKAIQQWEKGQRKKANQLFQEKVAQVFGWRSYAAMMSTDAPEPPPALRLGEDSRTAIDSTVKAVGQSATLLPVAQHANSYRAGEVAPRIVQAPAIPAFGVVLLPVVPQFALNANSIVDLGGHVQTTEFVAVPTELTFGRILRAVRVEGSCMEPEIKSGDVVLVEVGRMPLDGEVVAVEYEGRALIKVWWNEGDYVDLEANREGDTLRGIHKRNVTVLGVVVNGVYSVLRHQRRLRGQG